jgi:hypothetical protein
MFKHVNPIFWLVLGGVCVSFSCNLINKPPPFGSANSPTTLNHVADTVSVEIFIVRLAPHQNELLQQLWREVDEQSLPPPLRRELLEEGFRVGILGNQLSPALAQLLTISGDTKTNIVGAEFQEYAVADLAHGETVTRNRQTLLPNMRAKIQVFSEQNALPELTLFRKENGMICGQTYADAIGMFWVGATVNKDGSAQFLIVPEVEYGVMSRQLRAVAGMFVQDESKPRYSFESLAISQRLLPGQWLILGTPTPDSAGAGKAFFVRKPTSGNGFVMEQRLLAIRLAHVTPAAASTSTALPRGTETIMPERN